MALQAAARTAAAGSARAAATAVERLDLSRVSGRRERGTWANPARQL